MIKEIYLIRHGETEYNKLGMVQGCGIDADLNELGMQQAHAFFEYYHQVQFDKIYTSKLKRTHQSVAPFLAKGLPWQQLEGLNEISWGEKEGRIITPEDDKSYFRMIKAWRAGDLDQSIGGGESPNQVKARQVFAWKYILSNEHERRILICMHGRAMRIMLCHLTGLPLSDMDQFAHTNLCLYQLVYENGRCTILLENSTIHLSNLTSEPMHHEPVR